MQVVFSQMATRKFIHELGQYARRHNLAIAQIPVCPKCQIWSKELDRLYVVSGKITLDSKDYSGILLMVCSDCINDIDLKQLISDLELWVKSGFASIFMGVN